MKIKIAFIRKHLRIFFTVVTLTSLFVFVSCDDDDDNKVPQPTANIVEYISSQPIFDTLETAILTAGLETVLSGDGPFTVFAPSNEAFNNLDPTTLNTILSTPELLTSLLQYHVVSGKVSSSDLSNGDVPTLLAGQTVNVDLSNGVTLNGASKVFQADIKATNGYVHIIDQVLIPEGFITQTITDLAVANSNFTILVDILLMPEFSDILAAASDIGSDLTVFAPTDDAFVNLLGALNKTSLDEIPVGILKEIVSYHILGTSVMSTELSNGMMAPTLLTGESVTVDLSSGVKIDNASVVAPDVKAVNGVIHGIDTVLLPSYVIEALGTVSEVYLFNTDYTILAAAIRKAELLETISTNDAITIFVPNNDAFAAAGITSLDDLTAEQLAPIILYHAVAGNVKAADLPADGMVQTVNGEKIFLGYLTNSILINGLTTITGTDIEMSNGVIHTIDRILTPPAIDVVDIAVALSQMETGAEFTVLVSLLTDPRFAAITQIIREAGDITIFAPTDAAFAEISETIETLSDDQITKVLTYHAFMGRAFRTAITDQLSIEMVNQENITFNLGANGVSISDMSNGEDANILEVNIQGSNGVIHVIDKVLIPAFEE